MTILQEFISRCGTVTTWDSPTGNWPFDYLPLHARWYIDPDPAAYKQRIVVEEELYLLRQEIKEFGVALREAMHRIETLPENIVPETDDPKPACFICWVPLRRGFARENLGLRNFCKA